MPSELLPRPRPPSLCVRPGSCVPSASADTHLWSGPQVFTFALSSNARACLRRATSTVLHECLHTALVLSDRVEGWKARGCCRGAKMPLSRAVARCCTERMDCCCVDSIIQNGRLRPQFNKGQTSLVFSHWGLLLRAPTAPTSRHSNRVRLFPASHGSYLCPALSTCVGRLAGVVSFVLICRVFLFKIWSASTT